MHTVYFLMPSFSYMYFLSARLYSGNQKYFLCSKDFLCRFSFHLIQSDVTHYLMKNMRINAESRVWAVHLRYGNFPILFILLFCIYVTDMFIHLDSKDPSIQKYDFLIEVQNTRNQLSTIRIFIMKYTIYVMTKNTIYPNIQP